jgi:hypothetical protein
MAFGKHSKIRMTSQLDSFGTLEHLVAASEIDKYPNRSAWDIREILAR